jgi:bacillithiol biosynthesis deacetylase BshB1
MSDEKIDILVFGAHADDIELSAGGTVIQAVKRGQRVGLVDLTRGEMGTRGTPEIRSREADGAREAMGALFRHTLDFGDGNLRTGRDEELAIMELVRRYRPELVIAPYPDDRHPDHTRAGKLVTEASFYAGLRKIESDFPAHRPHSVVYYALNYLIQPAFVVDVTHVWEQKKKAIACYASQFYNPNSPEPQTVIAQKSFLDRIEGMARHYGSLVGAEFGEAFASKNPPRVDDLVAAYRGREVS